LPTSTFSRRALFGAALYLPAAVSIGACSQMSGKPRYTLATRRPAGALAPE
jgi:hypothetical protein